MNKKFSTLLAGVALLGATSVFAADNVTSLVEGTNSGLYQLVVGDGTARDQFLSVNADGKLVAVPSIEADNVASTLWCVTVTEENKGKAPYFDFVNKGAEALLAITMEEFAVGATVTTVAPEVGGEISGWAFSSTYETLQSNKSLYSYFTTDSVVGFVVGADNTVTLKKELASKVVDGTFTSFSLVEADSVTLNATQINTKLGIQKADAGVTLKFTPDANKTSLKNPFSQESFLAADAEDGFVYITRKADDKALFVDTAFINTTGSMFLAFNYMEDLDELKDSDLEGHGQFLFTYFPTNDSLVIQVKSIIKEPTAGSWAATAATSITDNDDDFNYVTVQDLVKADQIRVVTIGEKKETDIVLGFTSCKESDTDRVSLEDGVYFIRNAKTNKYYASPIHIDGAKEEWVSVDADEQNVDHMPAYQWVVLKTKTSEYFAATSPVEVANREYASLNGTYQFTQAIGSSKYFCADLAADSLVITKITDANILGDEHLGYKYLTEDELMITNYAFNYFNPYTMEKYIAQVAGSNKLNVLQDTPTYFEIKPVNGNVAADYGYKVTADVKKRIKGLAQLKRESYTIHTKKAVIALREPSLGPCFGMKGGAAGGGYAQVLPMEKINLHFTGDFHAITSANNLLAALLDNHIQQGNALRIDTRQIVWKRCLDMNDRVLRNVVVGLGSKTDGFVREDHFVITVASEIMAILCLATDLEDLKDRLGKIIVAYDLDGKPVTAKDLQAVGAMAALLKDAILPNVIQTLEHTPALVHGGPFANIAHGCNSVRATTAALSMADYVVTEAGFGADLGAEKFFDIKCRQAGLSPDAVVLVATIRALKYNGGVPKAELSAENVEALEKGIVNLEKHIENLQKYKVPVVVTLNSFVTDSEAEIAFVKQFCEERGCEFAISEVWEKGGEGGIALAEKVLKTLEEKESHFEPLYPSELPLTEKIETVAKEIYGAKGVNYTAAAKKQLAKLTELGFGDLPVCMAKTQYSLSDDPALLGRPKDFDITVREAYVSAGAGFVVVLTGAVMTMPGLPKQPAAFGIDVDESGKITGLF